MKLPPTAPRAHHGLMVSCTLLALVLPVALAGFSSGPGAASSLAAAPRPATPYTNLQYGFTMALVGNNATVRGMGYQWVSYTLGWDTAEPSRGAYNWGDADNIANYARNAGINVLIRVSRSPTWARDPACASNDTCPPASAADFGVFMGALAAHVRPLIAPYRVAYEVWNEPNTELEWGGLCPDPERYTALLQAAYPPVKGADPNAIVVAGSVTTVAQRQVILPEVCPMDDITFIERMYAAGARPFFDVLSDHPYGFTNTPEADPLTTQPALVFRRPERHRQVMEANGDSAKQIWATELGWALNPRSAGAQCDPPDWYYIYNPQQQADYLVRAHMWARSYWPWMGVMFTFNFDFSEAPWYETCHPFRFWSVKGRPAQAALAALVQNPPPTYTPAVDNPPQVRDVRYSALAFNRNGGTLTVDLDAYDDDPTPVDSVSAILRYPDGGTQLFNFTLVAGTNRSGTWRTSITLAPNTSGSTETYTVSPYVVENSAQRRTTNAPPQQITVTSTRFWDVPSDFWASEYIEYLANAGVISGYGDNSFRPNNNATRGQFSKMIVLGEGWPIDLSGAPHFTDVLPGSTYYQFVETAANHGVISGYADRTFRPNNNITRGQITKIIVLAENWAIVNPPTPSFTDVLPGSAFYEYIETAVSHGIVSGYGDRTFRPNNLATRAQLSKVLYLAIISHAPTATDTPTPTDTPTATDTPAATDTPVATFTPTPAKDTPTPARRR